MVGINLLREGLDLPEVSLVAILDADKEGFLRSETSLIQTMGRAARNIEGEVIMYADSVTPSMQRAISETERRRELQRAYNAEHNIDPVTIRKAVSDILLQLRQEQAPQPRSKSANKADLAELNAGQLAHMAERIEAEMKKAASELRFEEAARLRDEAAAVRAELEELSSAPLRH